MSFDRMIKKIIDLKNPTVAGLDPKLSYIPSYIKEKAFAEHGKTFEGAAAAILEFNKGLIDAICDLVPAVKPQCAYYEMYGWQGVRTLHETIAYAREKGLYVIADAKRNDIGSTMESYAAGFLGETDIEGETLEAFGADAMTVNGYLGTDGVKPALDICKARDKGIFILVKTSNPSSGELQDRMLGGKSVYETMGTMCESWGEDNIGEYGYSAVGAVVGATYPEELMEMRQKLPHTFFLVPGYGAQGGGAKGVAKAFDKDGIGAVVNSSRAIMCAYQKANRDEKEFAEAARDEVLRMRADITQYL